MAKNDSIRWPPTGAAQTIESLSQRLIAVTDELLEAQRDDWLRTAAETTPELDAQSVYMDAGLTERKVNPLIPAVPRSLFQRIRRPVVARKPAQPLTASEVLNWQYAFGHLVKRNNAYLDRHQQRVAALQDVHIAAGTLAVLGQTVGVIDPTRVLMDFRRRRDEQGLAAFATDRIEQIMPGWEDWQARSSSIVGISNVPKLLADASGNRSLLRNGRQTWGVVNSIYQLTQWNGPQMDALLAFSSFAAATAEVLPNAEGVQALFQDLHRLGSEIGNGLRQEAVTELGADIRRALNESPDDLPNVTRNQFNYVVGESFLSRIPDISEMSSVHMARLLVSHTVLAVRLHDEAEKGATVADLEVVASQVGLGHGIDIAQNRDALGLS